MSCRNKVNYGSDFTESFIKTCRFLSGLDCVGQLVLLKFLSSIHVVISLPIIVGLFYVHVSLETLCTQAHSFFTTLQHTRTFCTFSVPSCQSPALLALWTTFCLFIVNALLISTSPQRAAWPFIQVWMGMTQIPDPLGAPWPGPALWDCGLPLHASPGTQTGKNSWEMARTPKCTTGGPINPLQTCWGSPSMIWCLMWPEICHKIPQLPWPHQQ